MDSPLLNLIESNQWGDFQPLMLRLYQWAGYPLFLRSLKELKRDALYQSPVHGLGHIERTMLHGAFCAMEEQLSPADTALLLDCCAYHDVGRVDDSKDDLHGHRSASQLARLTGVTGDDLILIMAAVDAHSRPDRDLVATLRRYQPADFDRCLRLARLLKDSDGLDRVRIWDLDVKHLRFESSKKREDFAEYLFARYQESLHASTTPPFPLHLLRRLDSQQTRRDEVRGRSPRFSRHLPR